VSLDFGRQGRSELLDPAQNGSSADIDTAIGKEASNAFGGGTQLQVIPDREQDDVAWETMA